MHSYVDCPQQNRSDGLEVDANIGHEESCSAMIFVLDIQVDGAEEVVENRPVQKGPIVSRCSNCFHESLDANGPWRPDLASDFHDQQH